MDKKGFSLVLVVILVALLAAGGIIVFTQFPRRGGGKLTGFQSGAKKSTQERKFVALGASMTKANNLSSSLVGDHPEYSFATGTKLDSLYLYLKNQGENLTAVNLAESGANSTKVLQQQVPNALGYHPRYVTIDMMADILEENSPQSFQKNLRLIIDQVKGEDTTILIGSYPNFPFLRRAAYPSCGEDKLGVGFDKLTAEKIQLFNQAIQAVAQEKGLIFVDLYDVLGPEDVSDYDCVHPNIEGQKKLAKAWISALTERR